jgi:hypothetical protein
MTLVTCFAGVIDTGKYLLRWGQEMLFEEKNQR